MNQVKECPVCLEKFGKTNAVACTNKSCLSKICKACCSQLFAYCAQNRTLPLCVMPGCGSHYDYRLFEDDDILKYSQAVINHFTASYEQIINFRVNKNDVIANLRDARKIYIRDNFPKGVYLVACIALESKLKRINSESLKRVNDRPKRPCMNHLCKGALSTELLCNLCNTQFCDKCEKRIMPSNNHTCKSEDVDAVSYIRALVKCPKCQVGVEKSDGCNHMTCTFCSTKFDYASGIASTIGNSHNQEWEQKTTTFIERIDPLLKNIKNGNKLKSLIVNLETNAPKPASIDKLITAIVAHTKQQKNASDVPKPTRADIQVLYQYNNYNMQRIQYKSFINALNEIEFKLVQKTLSIDELQHIHDFYNSLKSM